MLSRVLHQDLGRNIVVDERAPNVLWLSFNKTEGNTGEFLAAPTATFGVASATITTVEQGAVQEIQVVSVSGATGGTFRLVHANTATEAIPFDASSEQMEVAIGRLPSLGKVKVKLEEADRVWSVTFVSYPGNVPTLTTTSSLTGGTVSVATRRDGTSRPLEGKIKVAFGGSGWATIFANNTEQEVSDTLNGLGIDVSVERVFLVGVFHTHHLPRTARRCPFDQGERVRFGGHGRHR